MSRMVADDLFYGNPERVRYVAGRGGGYGGAYQAGPHYYSDGEDYYSHRHSGHGVYPSTGRPMLPDVRLSVPMDSARCVDKVKDALDISGVHGVHCDVPNQTVTVSGNIAPQTLLKKVKQVKRKSKILSYTSGFTNSAAHVAPHHVAPHHRRTTSAYGAPAYGSSAYTSSYYRSGHLPSPPRDYAFHSQHNQHALAPRPGVGVYHSQYRPSQDYHYTNY